MAQNYTRQSSFADGDTITAALFNNEFNQVVNAFAYSASSDNSTGHKHDGTSGQGGNIPQIGDIDFLNKIVVDNTNNRWGFYVQVSGGTVEQLRIQDGAVVPVTNNDIDLGTSSLEFKDLFLDGTAHIDTLDVDVNATVAGTLGVTGATTLSSTLGVTGAITGSSTLQATTITATTAFVPDASDGASLGTVSLEFSDLFLADGALIAFGNDQDVTITHLADAGLLLNGARGLFFNDTTQYINAPNGTTLDIAATDEIELNATLIDINGAADVSGNLAVGGNLTVTGNATIAGNLTFGDAATDTVAFSADVASNLLPSVDNTYDLGASGSEWKDLYIDGTANIDSLIADTADINGGTIDGATIATSDITVGSGKTLDVSAGTLTLADNQISGDKVEGGTIAATTITTLTSTTVDTTNLEVTTLKAKDGTAAGSIADSTGVVTLASSVLTTTDINGGTIDSAVIGGTTPAAITGTAITATGIMTATGTSVFASLDISGDIDVDGTTNLDVVDIDGAVDFASTTAHAGNATFADNAKAIFGAGSDLQIYHDGSHSYIDDNGTGDLLIRAENNLFLKRTNSDETYFSGAVNGAVTLFHNNNAKLSTAISGIDVTGTVTADGLSVDGTFQNPLAVFNSTSGYGRIALQENGVARMYMQSLNGADGFKFMAGDGTSERMRIDASGNVGIGTSSPSNKLHVNADAGGSALAYLNNTNSQGYGLLINTPDINNARYALRVNTGAGTPFFVGNGGNVGIGTSTPSSALEVVGGAALGSGFTQSRSGHPTFGINSGGTDSVYFSLAPDGGSHQTFMQVRDDDTDVDSVAFSTSGTERMRIDASGNVGIGCTPAETLDVKSGNASTYLRLQTATNSGVYVGNANGQMLMLTGATERMRIDSTGRVGIGRTPSISNSKLEVGGADNVSLINVEASGVTGGMGIGSTGLQFFHGSSAKMRIDASGNVGIGESSPAEKLEVAGNILLNASNAEVNLRSGATGTSGAINWTFNTDTTDFASIKLAYDDRNTTGLHIDSGYPITLDASGSGTIFAQSGNEKARIDASGNLLVSDTTANPSGDNVDSGIALHSGGLVRASTNNAAAPLDLNVKGRDGDIAVFRKDGTTVGSIGTEGNDLAIGNGDAGLQFIDGTQSVRPFNMTTNARIDAQVDLGMASTRFKNLYLSGGVVFGATGGSVSSKTLDDYEEGVWTPTIVGSTTSGAFTYSVQEGTYTKVGDLVTVASAIYVTATATSPVGNVSIYGLPFTIGNQFPSFTIGWSQFITFADPIGAYGGGTQITLRKMLSGGSGAFVSGADFGSSFYLFISGSYHV